MWNRLAVVGKNKFQLGIGIVIASLVLFLCGKFIIDSIRYYSVAPCKDCNVIVITMTNLRYDHMSQNGYKRPTTPNIDAFAKGAIVFDNAFGHASWTLPEGISIYTGLYPYSHGVMARYDGIKLSKKIPTLFDTLKKHGYQTAGFFGGFDYSPQFGLTSRLSHIGECPQTRIVPTGSFWITNDYGHLDCTVPEALEWLKKNKDKKFFLHVQGFDVHCPFGADRGNKGMMYDKDYQGGLDFSGCVWTFDQSAPVKKDGKLLYEALTPLPKAAQSTVTQQRYIYLDQRDITHLVALYDESITKADKQVGFFLKGVKELGLSDNTIIIFTSEHGDMFGKYGRFMRGGPLRGTFYDDVLHVPLIVKNPAMKGGIRIKGFIQHIDILPSLYHLLGISQDHPVEGKDATSMMQGGPEIQSVVFAGSKFLPDPSNGIFTKESNIMTIRSKEWKLITESLTDGFITKENKELYDLKKDPGEQHNLSGSNQQKLKELESQLTRWFSGFGKK